MDVVDYYSQEETRLEREVSRLTEESLNRPLGVAFVRFDSINSSKAVYDDLKTSYLSCFKSNPKQSSLSPSLRPDKWRVSFAPVPTDINWVNLKKGKFSLLKIILVNVGFGLIGLFFTTPEILASQINAIIQTIVQTDDHINVSSPILELIPTVLLVLFSKLMPLVITLAVMRMGYSFKSTENYIIFRNTFWYLWIVVLIFPTFGLTTVKNLLVQTINSQTNGTRVDINWECFFSADTSSFFVNYVISTAFIGTATELLRFKELQS